MNESIFRKLFPRASKSCLEANIKLRDAQFKCNQTSPLDAPIPGKEEVLGRITVSYRLFRVRPLDPDNATGSTKDCTDGLCRCGLLPGDDPWSIELRVAQEKVKTYSEERTEIVIEYP